MGEGGRDVTQRGGARSRWRRGSVCQVVYGEGRQIYGPVRAAAALHQGRATGLSQPMDGPHMALADLHAPDLQNKLILGFGIRV